MSFGRTMKLLFISNLFPDTREPYRGLDNAVLLQHLAREFEIRVVSPRPHLLFRSRVKRSCRQVDAAFRPVYADYFYVPKAGSIFNHRLFARSIRTLLRRVKQEFPFEVILVSWAFPDVAAIARLQRELNVPFVAVVQGSDAHAYLKMPLRRGLIVSALNRSSAAITRSKELARLLERAGVAPQKLHPVYNGVDLQLFHPADDKHVAKKEAGLDPKAASLLFVGNFYPVKNPELLVRAFAGLCRQRADSSHQLVMVGGGPLEPWIRMLATQLGCAGNIVFAGRKNAVEVAGYMRAADLLCLSSKNEGVPNVVLEAFASGVPVMSTAVGGLPEVVNSDFLGRLAEPENVGAMIKAMVELLEQKTETARIREYAQRFSWDIAASCYVDLLNKAVS